MASAPPTMTSRQYTAAQIKKAREQHLGLTQRELAIELAVEQVSVSRWERNVAEPKLRYIRAIAELAQLPVNWFFQSEAVA
jgi:transcriptional regulator with XRE-family HTH domain